MPRRIARRGFELAERHWKLILTLETVALIVALIFAISGYNKARNVEQQLAAEQLGKDIADVTTCFNSARNRPRLIVILRGIAVELEPDPRQALNQLIDEYETDTPTLQRCSRLARDRGIDPRPYLRNPPPGSSGPNR